MGNNSDGTFVRLIFGLWAIAVLAAWLTASIFEGSLVNIPASIATVLSILAGAVTTRGIVAMWKSD